MKRAGIIFLVMIMILTGIIRLSYLRGPVDRYNEREIAVNIEKGSTTREIAGRLRQKELILSPELFVLLADLKDQSGKLQAGFYRLKQSYSLTEILDIISQGKVASIKITIPEGFTAGKIATLLAEKTDYQREDYLFLLEDGPGFDQEYLPEPGDNYIYRLEGFLYPDTYQIPERYTPRQIIELMLNQFEKTWLSRLQEEDLSTRELVTLASLIQSEARLDSEKPIIAGVIYNRLQQDMLLQVDASIQYVLPERKQRILYSDLEIESPYNTYLHRGLPPGPICNPGKVAIEASLEPTDVEFLFYFALADGSHIFTRTYQEHLEMQQKIEDAREENHDGE